MTYTRKTQDTWQLWVNYGQGWEHEVTEFTRRAGIEQRNCYRENCPEYAVRLKYHREPIAEDSVASRGSASQPPA